MDSLSVDIIIVAILCAVLVLMLIITIVVSAIFFGARRKGGRQGMLICMIDYTHTHILCIVNFNGSFLRVIPNQQYYNYYCF